MKVRCKLCSHCDGKFCMAKKNGGKYPKVKLNKKRDCSKYKLNPTALAAEADKEYEKNKIPRYAPTWRYYADEKELSEEKGPLFVRINPNA